MTYPQDINPKTKVKVTLSNSGLCMVLFLFSGTFGTTRTMETNHRENSSVLYTQTLTHPHLAGRSRRDVNLLNSHTFAPSSPIPENVQHHVTLFDLVSTGISGTYILTGNSANVPFMFVIIDNRYLRLNSTLSTSDRGRLDFETFPVFEVFFNITRPGVIDDVMITVQLSLRDVNDESPRFEMEPTPFLAQVPPNTPPGTPVYRVRASDDDTNSELYMTLAAVDPSEYFSEFKLLPESTPDGIQGLIVTAGYGGFTPSDDITLTITVEDRSGVDGPQTTMCNVHVFVGVRPPQFYSKKYTGYIKENMQATDRNIVMEDGGTPLIVNVVNFDTSSPVTLRVLEADGEESARFEMEQGGQIVATTPVDFEVTKGVNLTLEAIHVASNGRSKAELRVIIRDENNHRPRFTKSFYIATVSEDAQMQSSVFEVTATDLDTGLNGELVFSLPNNDYFFVDTVKVNGNMYVGKVNVKRQLDYESVDGPHLAFPVLVEDKGFPSWSSTARIVVLLENANDNPPTISVDRSVNNTVGLMETVIQGSVVTAVQSSDRDGDDVRISFAGGNLIEEIFSINPRTGLIRTTGPVDGAARERYELTIVAKDDGTCCGGGKTLTSTSVLTVTIVDVNAHKPDFKRCASYDMMASVMERSPNGTWVMQVSATDPDRGDNGRVIYEMDKFSVTNSHFVVDSTTGEITVNRVFDRGTAGYEQVTVIGRNPGKIPEMKGWCSFRIAIEDINDHAPRFSKTEYHIEVSGSNEYPQPIFQMVATDEDSGSNAQIRYGLQPLYNTTGSDGNGLIFTIDETTGVVCLVQQLSMLINHEFDHLITATDYGVYPSSLSGTTHLKIKVVNDTGPPSWVHPPDRQEFFVHETENVGHVITELVCHPVDDFVVYHAEDSITVASDTFRVTNASNAWNLVTTARLDYQYRNNYIIRIACLSLDRSTLRSLTISVLDDNNKIPMFVGLIEENDGYYVGSTPENSGPGFVVSYVQALDEDEKPEYNRITFSLEGETSNRLFNVNRVDDTQAKIVTRDVTFDRETQGSYYIKVIAEDGAPSAYDPSRPNRASRQIHVTVSDVNDCPPSFPHPIYTARVSEMASIGQFVLSVTATDPDLVDSSLDYVFVEGNEEGTFSVTSGNGKVKVAKMLDYESMGQNKTYHLRLQATDQGSTHTATTSVHITVTDVNDHRPVFNQPTYTIRGLVVEHNASVTPDNPLFLTQVTATDADISRPQTDIRYYLLNTNNIGNSLDNLFSVNETSGDVFLTGVLDRDGILPFYTLVVMAEDERELPLVGYADVEVFPIDINDNAPVFWDGGMRVEVDEHSPVNTLITTLIATDKDEGLNGAVQYRLSTQQPSPSGSEYFSLDIQGRLTTQAAPDKLDRERNDRLFVAVVAQDLGTPPRSATATVTVILKDVNDQPPCFLHREYNISVSENHVGLISGQPVRAVDSDVDPANRNLVFTLEGNKSVLDNFHVYYSPCSDGTALIGVTNTNLLDYETTPHELEFTIAVTDGLAIHKDHTNVRVFVSDVNDNRPIFNDELVRVTLPDGTPRSTEVTQFKATDRDEGINSEIVYSILRQSDRRYEFYIDPDSGKVTTRRDLDRELEPLLEVIFIATDKGEPPLSSSATLLVTLTDTNDCPPEFREPYSPKVEENVPNVDTRVVEIFAIDRDTPPFGPPFGFKLPDGCDTLACQFFQLEMNEAGDDNNGTAIIRTNTTFDREFQKEFHLPIVMWDMRGSGDNRSQTASNTLTIVIGDQNDNRHFPGHQHIHVFNYKGTKGPKEIGRVYAPDLDDWDLPDKSFKADLSDDMKNWFSVSEDTGMVTMHENVLPNRLQPFQTYQFQVKVYDKTFGNTETCTVSVLVEDLSEEAVWKAGAIRLEGVTAEGFILPQGTRASKYDIFRKELSTILGYPNSSHVEIVSLQDSQDGGLDVRYSVHGSPYLNPAHVESAVMLHQQEIESRLGVNITMLPINLCLEEIYPKGCSTVIDVTGEANLVNANGTSFVGVKAVFRAVAGCQDCLFPTPDRCTGDYCYNGGTCGQDDWGKLSCQCHLGFDGPRCQQRRHHYNGTSVAFYKSLSVCADGRTMFDFITLEEDGLVMFSGSSSSADRGPGHGDYYVFELKSGYPHVRISLGDGELALSLNGTDRFEIETMGKLNDGKWHHIDLDKRGQRVQLTVDKCRSATPSQNGIIHDWSSCRVSGHVPGLDLQLNTPGFLQIGGHYSPPGTSLSSDLGLPGKGFSGCLKDLYHNSKLYDLSYKDIPGWNSGTAHCPREDRICEGGDVCGQRADCLSEWKPVVRVVDCTCHPGWMGSKCEKETPIKDFDSESFFKWQLSSQLISGAKRDFSLSLMFRTRQLNGTLFSMVNNQLDFFIVRLSHGKVVVTYTRGPHGRTITLDKAHTSSGQWHSLRVQRWGTELIVMIDNREGRNRNFIHGHDNTAVWFASLSVVSSGARVSHVTQSNDHVVDDLTHTCISDVRFNDVWLPMDTTDNTVGDGWLARLLDARNIKDGCHREDCVPDECGPELECRPLWEQKECRCPSGSHDPGNGDCVRDCTSHVCHNEGVCVMVDNVSSCRCVGDWTGDNCHVMSVMDNDDVIFSSGEIVGVAIAILVFIVLLVCLIIFIVAHSRRRKGDKDSLQSDFSQDDDFIRENIMYYDEEGAGEKDSEGYNLDHLQKAQTKVTANSKPVKMDVGTALQREPLPAPLPPLNIQTLISKRMANTEGWSSNPDGLRVFADEGSTSIAGSLSSLSSVGSGEVDTSHEYDYLDAWGPKFSRLAGLYGTE